MCVCVCCVVCVCMCVCVFAAKILATLLAIRDVYPKPNKYHTNVIAHCLVLLYSSTRPVNNQTWPRW